MIAFVSGIVRLIRTDSVVLDVHGVGYEVFISNALTQKIGDELFLYTYQHVREDAMLLYGFIKQEDYEVFMRLINVKGIGPKTAQTMLDLKGKFVSVETKEETISNPVWKETQEALVALGYKVNQLTGVRKELANKTDLNVNEMLRMALAILAKRNGV